PLPPSSVPLSLHDALPIYAPLVLPGHELIDPHHAHPDLAAVERIEGARVAVGDHGALVEVAQGGDRLADGAVLALVDWTLGELLIQPRLPVHPAHGEADAGDATLDAVVAEAARVGLDPRGQLVEGLGRRGDL